MTFASVLVQARVSGPGAPPTNTSTIVPALTLSLLLDASLGFPSASKSNMAAHIHRRHILLGAPVPAFMLATD